MAPLVLEVRVMHRLIFAALLFAACGGSPSADDMNPGAIDTGPPVRDMASSDIAYPDMAPGPDLAPPVPSSQGIGANDVSVLFPLPADQTGADTLLSLSTMGNGGPLLSTDQFAQLVPLNHAGANRPYAEFRVVAARIDPCFPSLGALTTAPSSCHHQLRLIAQPLTLVDESGTEDSGGTFGAADAAIHLLYDLDENSFTSLTTSWLALATTQTADRSLRLGVHPTILAEGLTGTTANAFRALIVQYAGASTLYRVTSLNGNFASWEFMGLNATSSGLVPIQIAGLPSNGASMNGIDELLESDGTCNGPFDANADSTQLTGLRPLGGQYEDNGVAGCQPVVFPATPADMTTALQLSLQIDDPTSTFDADTVDCTSCHVASRGRYFAMDSGFSVAGLTAYTNAKRALGVPGDVASIITQQRAFGYRGQTVVINQRAVNESAAVADALETITGM